MEPGRRSSRIARQPGSRFWHHQTRAIHPSMHLFTGIAMCFDTEEDATRAIMGRRVTDGTVVVIRYEGPCGGPGMPEMYAPMKYLHGRGLALKTALVTDGRFS